MSQDILTDFNIVHEHPQEINSLMDDVLKQARYLYQEWGELYEEITKRIAECSFQMEELSDCYRNSRNSSHTENAYEGEYENNRAGYYREENESDFYNSDLREAYAYLEEKLDRLKRAKSILENVSGQVNEVYRKSQTIKAFSKEGNCHFKDKVNKLIDLYRRGLK